MCNMMQEYYDVKFIKEIANSKENMEAGVNFSPKIIGVVDLYDVEITVFSSFSLLMKREGVSVLFQDLKT